MLLKPGGTVNKDSFLFENMEKTKRRKTILYNPLVKVYFKKYSPVWMD